MSGYGSGGYPGQGYDEDPRQRRRGGPSRGNEPGYGDPGQEYGGYDPRGYDQQGSGGYRTQGSGPQPGQYDPRQGTGPRRPQGQAQGQGPGQGQGRGQGPRQGQRGYDQRMGQRQRGYNEWDAESDSSFLPGFGGREDYDNSRAQERGGRYDDRGGRGPGDGGGRGGRGPGPRDRYDARGDRPDDRRPLGDGDWDDRDRKPRKKATRWFPRILILAVVAVIVIGGGIGGLKIYHKYEDRYHPADYAGPGTGDVVFQVKSGDTAFSIAPRLLAAGVIASERAFTNAAENTTTTTITGTSSNGLNPGFYQLHQHMQASLAYAALLNPKNLVQTTVTIVEGKRAVDVIAILAEKAKIPLKDFQQVLANPAQLGLPSYANGKAEGYLFPATYAIVPHETALQILQAMVERFNVEAQQINLVNAAKAAGLTPTNLIIEASLAQAEGGSVSDYPKIAEVINNRLKIGMHLQFDSTVLYGLGKYAVSATIKQTQTPGPYNTYLNAGLPAGPISNPGDAAIQGILHPEHGSFLYFLTKPGGKSEFSATPLKGQ